MNGLPAVALGSGLFADHVPMLTALVAIATVVVWQVVGTVLLAPLLRRGGLPRLWAALLSWLIWLPVCGAVVQGLAVAGLVGVSLLRVLTALAALAAGAALYSRLRRGSRTRFSMINLGALPPSLKVGLIVAGLFQIVQLVYAAHPQRQYDQLNYHLVVGKKALIFGTPFTHFFDPHFLIAGPVDYGFTWLRAWYADDLFQIAAAQCWVYIAAIPPCLAALWAVARSMGERVAATSLITAALVLPGLLPNGELVHIAKPGATLFAGALVTLSAGFVTTELFQIIALSLTPLLAGCNPTYVHAAIAFAVVLGFEWRASRRPVSWPFGLVAAGAVFLASSLLRSLVVTGTLLYPTDAKFLPTPYADAQTLAYWHYIAFGSGQSFLQRYLGVVSVPWRGPGLSAWLLLGFVVQVALWRRRSPARVTRNDPESPAMTWHLGLKRLVLFLAAYGLVWPLFYDGHIFSRFVAAYLGALVVAAFVMVWRAPPKWRSGLLTVGMVLALACSSIDDIVRKVIEWNQSSLATAMAQQYPRYVAMQELNKNSGALDTVLSDGPEKLFLNAAALSSAVSPQERQAWSLMTQDAHAGALALHVTAVVIEAGSRGRADDQRPFVGPVYQVFEALVPYGNVASIGPDLVLTSACYFQAANCRLAPDLSGSL